MPVVMRPSPPNLTLPPMDRQFRSVARHPQLLATPVDERTDAWQGSTGPPKWKLVQMQCYHVLPSTAGICWIAYWLHDFLKWCPDTSVLCQSKTSWSNAPPLLPKCSPHPTTFESPCSGHFYAVWMTGWPNLFRWLNLSLRNLNISWLLNQQSIECEV